MSKEELIRVKEDIIELNKELSEYSEEITELEKTEVLKRYFWLKTNIERVSSEIEDKTKEEKKIGYELCNHDILYLMSYGVKRKMYYPKFICLSCGKRIIGSISTRQTVINDEYLDYVDDIYIGDESECTDLSSKYSELEEQGCSTSQIIHNLHSVLDKKHGGRKLSVYLIRK